jgi:PAS domain S-box-containing protein
MALRTSHSKQNIFREHSLLLLFVITITLATAATLWFELPKRAAKGEQGQKAIQMLDEMRRPLLAIKAAELQFNSDNKQTASRKLTQAITSANELVNEYLSLSEYNEELRPKVLAFKESYVAWVDILNKAHLNHHAKNEGNGSSFDRDEHHFETSGKFLEVMNDLGEGEHPIHHDIDDGRFATRVMASLFLAIILMQAIAFISHVIRKSKKLTKIKERLENEVVERTKTQIQADLVIENTPGVIYSAKYDGQQNFIPTFCTPNIKQMMGYDPESFFNQKNLWAENIHPEDAPTVFEHYNQLFQDDKLLHRYRWRHKNGEYLWIRDEVTLARDESGEPDQIVGVWVDINEQKAIEFELEEHQKELEASVEKLIQKNLEVSRVLNEKEVLFKELHHRVKNNMQVVSALLGMQSMRSNNNEVIKELSIGKDRIDSMALVHELLYQSNDMTQVDLIKYINELGEMLLDSYRADVDGATISVDGDVCLLNPESIVPLGLILNELITNSFQHGFSSSKEGKIKISCNINKAGNLVVHYSDNGIGIPEAAFSEASNSLGLSLIENLSKQLDATIEFYNNEGMQLELIAAIR